MAKTIIDFWADWCMPCRTIGAVLDDVGRAGQVTVKRHDTGTPEGEALALKLLVSSLPHVILREDGREDVILRGSSPANVDVIRRFAGL
jgi:thioredoxin-like negative regulator of GroEL